MILFTFASVLDIIRMTRDNNCSISARHKLSLMGVIVTLGIVFGDIGTSPLYVMRLFVRAGNPC